MKLKPVHNFTASTRHDAD